MLDAARSFASHVTDLASGAWVQGSKVCAMGVKLSRWVTMHGLTLALTLTLALAVTLTLVLALALALALGLAR